MPGTDIPVLCPWHQLSLPHCLAADTETVEALRMFFSLAKQLAGCWGGCTAAGSIQPLWEKAGYHISSKAQPAHTGVHLIPDQPVGRNKATVTAEPLGFTAGVLIKFFLGFFRIFFLNTLHIPLGILRYKNKH